MVAEGRHVSRGRLGRGGRQGPRTDRRGHAPRSDPDIQALNDEWFEAGRGLEDDIVRIRFAKGRVAMRQAFSRLSEVDANAWEWFEESGPRHYEEHLADLRAFLERSTHRP